MKHRKLTWDYKWLYDLTARESLYEIITSEHRIIERKDQKPLVKFALAKWI